MIKYVLQQNVLIFFNSFIKMTNYPLNTDLWGIISVNSFQFVNIYIDFFTVYIFLVYIHIYIF